MTIPASSYDCDTSGYWTSKSDYHDNARSFGRFIDGGTAYEILDGNTPRPWLNYLCNEKFASVVSNTGLGFSWYLTSLLRVTKYEHTIDYLPRTFEDGRIVWVQDLISGESGNPFADPSGVRCIHRPGVTEIMGTIEGLEVSLQVFVPVADPGECWVVRVRNPSAESRSLSLSFVQKWCFAKFGIHTAEEGIPYLTTPGRDQQERCEAGGVYLFTKNPELPFEMEGLFVSPEACAATCTDEVSPRRDVRKFRFPVATLSADIVVGPGETRTLHVFSGADRGEGSSQPLSAKYLQADAYGRELKKVLAERRRLSERISADLPSPSISLFLNTWLKNQLYLTFRYVRSGFFGFRDTLQDTWGYTLLDPEISRRFLLRTLAHVRSDGVCPRNYSIVDRGHDLRAFMDSGTWIAQTLVDYVKETGDFSVLDERIAWLDTVETSPVLEHVLAALNLLYEKRGRHGLCLVGDGDWNDALEGISRGGEAVSAWLTMALFHAQNLMAELCKEIDRVELAELFGQRSKELARCLNTSAWDGEWYVYGFTGSGRPIGSSQNSEGRIHLNAQTWAIITGLADEERVNVLRRSIRNLLETPNGPALLAPPYVKEAGEVGRIARLEPGTFENGAVYMHAAAFSIYADLVAGFPEDAVKGFERLLPTNPLNFDARRTSEPYCTGNYYCGPGHPREGQNFFTWFTGNAPWLMRAGFDKLVGIQAGYRGLHVAPMVPHSWGEFRATRIFRGQQYEFEFRRTGGKGVIVDGSWIEGSTIPAPTCVRQDPVKVRVNF